MPVPEPFEPQPLHARLLLHQPGKAVF